MCGIAGIVRGDGARVEDQELKDMQSVLLHRGPDDSGIFVQDNPAHPHGFSVGLAHCRLSILDLSSAGRQPMISEDGSIVLVHNGEIYNHEELRSELAARGHAFRSRTDTEVLIHAYIEWGPECLGHFNGMFAFALWDKAEKRLFCARDRLGVKPFYYFHDGKTLIFASEIKSILASKRIKPKANYPLIIDFLQTGLVEHTNETFFQEIMKLPAGMYMDLDSGGLNLHRYWDFEVSDALAETVASEQTAETFKHLLTDSVALRLRGDVPVGSCLSGGIDSSSIVCLINSLIAPQQKKNVGDFQKVFSAISQSPRLDERPFIREVVKLTKAESACVEPSADGFMEELDPLLWHQEEPFTNSSVYAQWCVFRKAKESGIKVMLDGQGADEQLCGYRKFSYFFLRELQRRRMFRRFAQESLSLLRNYQYYKAVDLRHGLRYFGKLGGVQHIFNPRWQQDGCPGPAIGFDGSMARRIKLDLTNFSLPSLLRYEDKNSMAFSIESRVPYLDFRLVEFIAGLPLDAKLWRGWTKYVLRMSMQGIIPEVIRLRKDKLAFDTPQDFWIRTRWKDSFLEVYKSDGPLSKVLNREKLLPAFERYLSRKSRISGNFFFRSFILQKWADRFSISLP